MVEFRSLSIKYAERLMFHDVSIIVKAEISISVYEVTPFCIVVEHDCCGDTKEKALDCFLSHLESMLYEQCWNKFEDRLPMREQAHKIAKWKKISMSKYDELWFELQDKFNNNNN